MRKSKLSEKYFVGAERRRKLNLKILKALSRFETVKCYVWDSDEEKRTCYVDSVFFSKKYSIYNTTDGKVYFNAEPILKNKEENKKREPGLYIKSKKKIKKWLDKNGYVLYKGVYRPHNEDNIFKLLFTFEMFDLCGLKVNPCKEGDKYYKEYNFTWLSEWIEEVK